MGGAGRIGPRLYLRPRRRRPRPGTVRKCRLIMELKLTRCTLRPWRVGGEAVGGIGVELGRDVFYRSAEIGYWLGEPYWGRGIATEALRAITECAFMTFDLCRLQAGVFEWNPASMRVLEKAGFTLEARHRKNVTKDGETIDRVVYALVRPVQ